MASPVLYAVAALSAAFLMAGCSGKSCNSIQEAFEVETEPGDRSVMKCIVWLPQDYAGPAKPWPLVLSLHDAGECGNDLDMVKKHGLPMVLEDGRQFPFIVVAPQARRHGWNPEVLVRLLDQLVAHYSVDQKRVYLTGLSMGGYGTWAFAAAYPERFAAAVPICGGGDPRWAQRLKGLPIWVFHGARDNTVPLSESEQMVHALEAVGGNVRSTIYPDAGHDCWTRAYSDPRLYEWLLKQRRPAVPLRESSDWAPAPLRLQFGVGPPRPSIRHRCG